MGLSYSGIVESSNLSHSEYSLNASYVATLNLIDRSTNGSALALAAVVMVRFIPSLVLAPVTGVVADSFSRVSVMMGTSILDAIWVLCSVVVTDKSHLVYLFLVLQFSTRAFYNPPRAALLPRTVRASDLSAATTIDSLCWSLSGAIASSAGGFLASRLGVRVCFVADAATYVVSLLCTLRISRELGNPKTDEEEQPAPLVSNTGISWTSMSMSIPVAGGIPRPLPPSQSISLREHPGTARRLLQATVRGVSATAEGLLEFSAYLRAHPDVLWIATLKGAGAATWGSVDMLNTMFSRMKSMQSLGDASATLGIIFGAVGFACLFAPLILNPIVPPHPASLAIACAAGLLCVSAGNAIMAVAANIWVLLVAMLTRSAGSTLIWVYSSLALRLLAPAEMLGRLSAWEMAWYTIAQAGSGTVVGVIIDRFHARPFTVLRYVCAASLIVAAAWGSWAIQLQAKHKAKGVHAHESITMVSRMQVDDDEGEINPQA